MNTEDIKAMSDEDLMANWTSDGAEAEVLKARLKEYSTEYQNRCLISQATDLMGEDALAQLVQSVNANGVEPSSAVGSPGTGSDEEAVNV